MAPPWKTIVSDRKHFKWLREGIKILAELQDLSDKFCVRSFLPGSRDAGGAKMKDAIELP
jgi:hypothetical protein